MSEKLEEWRPVPGYDGCYMISTFGRVMRATGAPGTRPGKILKPCYDTGGYMRVSLSSKNKNFPRSIHSLMADVFLPGPREGKHVNHIDADKTNNRLDNLELISRRENVDHAVKLGLYKGANRGRVLTSDQVVEIKSLLDQKVRMREIADRFGVSRYAIYAIRSGRSWKNTG